MAYKCKYIRRRLRKQGFVTIRYRFLRAHFQLAHSQNHGTVMYWFLAIRKLVKTLRQENRTTEGIRNQPRTKTQNLPIFKGCNSLIILLYVLVANPHFHHREHTYMLQQQPCHCFRVHRDPHGGHRQDYSEGIDKKRNFRRYRRQSRKFSFLPFPGGNEESVSCMRCEEPYIRSAVRRRPLSCTSY